MEYYKLGSRNVWHIKRKIALHHPNRFYMLCGLVLNRQYDNIDHITGELDKELLCKNCWRFSNGDANATV